MTSRSLWLNPAFGISGDMLLGALIDVGADEGSVRKSLDLLDVSGWKLDVVEVQRRGLRCRHANVTAEGSGAPRTWSAIDDLLAGADLRPPIAAGARATFRRLAEVEAAQHGVGLDEVHFHEVGAVDAIVDIVGCWAALDALQADEVVSGPVGLGVGTVTTAHGTLPHPAPAVLGLLEDVPVTGLDSPAETATPTGVALLVTMVDRWGPVPSGRLAHSGLGAGTRDAESHPNVLGACTIEADESRAVDAALIETTLDDVTPEILGHVVDRALAAGADDAWLVPVVMKKSRPGHQLRVLSPPALLEQLVDLIVSETGTLGVRTYQVTKTVLPRSFDEVIVAGERIKMKVGPHGAKPEADDVIRAAEATGRSARAVAAEALRRWGQAPEPGP